MKKIYFFILSGFLCTNNLWAQLPDSVLVDCYGDIRADMVRTVCNIIGFKNDSVMQTISNESLAEFKKSVAKQDTLLRILAYAPSLSGKDVADYQHKMRKTRRDFQYQLGSYYPDMEIEIENAFRNYIKIIDDLTKECNCFNSDTTQSFEVYLKAYSSGHFTTLVDSLIVSNKENKSRTKNGVSEATEQVSDNKDNSKGQMEQSIFYAIKTFLISLLKWSIGTVLAVIFLVIAFRKRKKFMSHIHKIVSRIMRNEGITTCENKKIEQKNEDKKLLETVENKEIEMGKNENGTEKDQGGTLQQQTHPSQKEVGQKQEDENVPPPHENKTDQLNHSGEGETVPPTNVIEKPKIDPLDPQKGKWFAMDAGEWIVVGASVQGNGHIDMNLPCQDNHNYEYIKDGWGIAITSDGAGSAKLSHVGAAASVSRAMVHFKELVEKERWIEERTLPSDTDWMKKSYQVLKLVRNELDSLAKRNKCDIKDLSATIIVVIHSPLGLLAVHIGDGRAGYKDMAGEWHSLIKPHKGEEANQTIFIPSDFWDKPFYEMSGATVPESRVIREPISAFTLMSDGCESTSWLCNQFNKVTGKYYDPNCPHSKFFNPLIETLQSFRKDKESIEERQKKWYKFIKEGNDSFRKETDDKTMILGALYM